MIDSAGCTTAGEDEQHALDQMDSTQQIMEFLGEIGLDVICEPIERATFLPGVDVRGGTLIVDVSKLEYPSDLLHEAGHLAVVDRSVRAKLDGEVTVLNAEVIEVAAIAWSYAAAMHLGIAITELFHSGGYRGHAQALLLTYSIGVYPGASILADLGLTSVPGEEETPTYPSMSRWLVE